MCWQVIVRLGSFAINSLPVSALAGHVHHTKGCSFPGECFGLERDAS